MASRLAAAAGGAGAASPTGRPPRRSWAVLDRTPNSVEPEELPAGMDYVVSNTAPPNLSTLVLSRALLDNADDVRVECADSEGNILVSVSSSAQERRLLLVCRSGSGVVDALPDVRDAVGVLKTPPHAFSCAGIAPIGGGGDGYVLAVLAQLHRGGSSSSTSASRPTSSLPCFRLLRLFSSSSSPSWEDKEVTTRPYEAHSSGDEAGWASVREMEVEDDHPFQFQPGTVLCHPDGRRLVFVDLENGALLLISPSDPAPAGRRVMLPADLDEHGGLPDLEEEKDVHEHDARDAGARRCVASSEGLVCFIDWRCRGGESVVSGWSLREAEDENNWVPIFRAIQSAEFFHSKPSLGADLQKFQVPGLGALDPTNFRKVTFYCADGKIAFTAEVSKTETMPYRRVQFREQAAPADAGHNWAASWLDVVIWKFDCGKDPAAVGPGAGAGPGGGKWTMGSLRSQGRRLGAKTLNTLKTCRKYVDKAPAVAQVLGGGAALVGLPLAGMIVPAVNALVNVEKAAGVGQELFGWYGERRRARSVDDRVVGSVEEALRVVEEWVDRGKPNITVYPAPDLSHQEQKRIGDEFRRLGAGELVPLPPSDDDFYMVGEAAHYFPAG